MVRSIAAGVLLIGWFFVAWQNRFHFTAPLVMVELAYTAVIAIIFNMYRTGASIVMPDDEGSSDAAWGQPLSARAELEREKKALLKSIKEAEFDQMMGKLSPQDAEQMTKTMRARAIEVIKEIDRLTGVGDGTVRDQIEREVKARLELEAAVEKKTAVNVEKKAAIEKKKARGKRNKDRADAPESKADADDKVASDKVEAEVEVEADKANTEAEVEDAVVPPESSQEPVTKEVRS